MPNEGREREGCLGRGSAVSSPSGVQGELATRQSAARNESVVVDVTRQSTVKLCVEHQQIRVNVGTGAQIASGLHWFNKQDFKK